LIELWDAASGGELRTLSGHLGPVLSVAFSPDALMLASGSEDKTVKLWSVASGRELRALSGHSGAVKTVAFAPDSRTLASGSEDKTVKLWDVDEQRLDADRQAAYAIYRGIAADAKRNERQRAEIEVDLQSQIMATIQDVPKQSIENETGVTKTLGLTLSRVTLELSSKFALVNEAKGVVVVEVTKDSDAAVKGLRPGDVIMKVAAQDVKSPDDIGSLIDKMKKSGRKSILMVIDRRGDLHSFALGI
jgi:WD40 repeat protein